MYLFDITKLVFLDEFEWKQIPLHVLNCLLGNQGENNKAGGLALCWFIYTLIICKIIHQYIGRNKYLTLTVVLLCFSVALWYNHSDQHLYNAITNTSLAYPFYATGRVYKMLYISKIQGKSCNFVLPCVICIIIVYVVRWENGAPWMYDNRYGENLILFLIGGNVGTLAVFMVSYYLQNTQLNIISIISKGTIIILGFQKLLIRIFKHFPTPFDDDLVKYIFAFVILLLFIPIIQLSERYCPILLGYRGKRP